MKEWGISDPRQWYDLPGWCKALMMAEYRLGNEMARWEEQVAASKRRAPESWEM